MEETTYTLEDIAEVIRKEWLARKRIKLTQEEVEEVIKGFMEAIRGFLLTDFFEGRAQIKLGSYGIFRLKKKAQDSPDGEQWTFSIHFEAGDKMSLEVGYVFPQGRGGVE
ncbi:MAG TPA: hypothetical protein EYP20_01765 [Aigarchaeota archaeon]|nr:hypothetical protein [Aigarchaeota archaeon]